MNNSPNEQFNEQLRPNQQPLGTQFLSYELNKAPNYWTLDPFQYSITKFKFNLPNEQAGEVSQNDSGLIYRNVDFEKLLPAYTAAKKSVNDFPAQSYHRFQANDGYFNPNESRDNSDLWYYSADKIAMRNEPHIAGPALNVQEVKHIVFPEAQRGGLDTRNVSKYSTVDTPVKQFGGSWESENQKPVDNSQNCAFFNYNSRSYSNYEVPFNKVYSFDSNYVRDINIAGPYEGSMPFNPDIVQ